MQSRVFTTCDKARCRTQNKYEKQLSLADLGGNVPDDIARALMEAKQVCNVWAHNGGRADVKLLGQAPTLGHNDQRKVAITKPMLAKYLLVLKT